MTAAIAAVAIAAGAAGVTLAVVGALWLDRIVAWSGLDPQLTLAAVPAVAVAVAALVLLIGLRPALAPLRSLARRIRRLDPENPDQRLDGADAPGELRPIYDAVNDRLADIALALERERSFASHVAHELRTPLAGLRSEVEVTLSRVRTAEEYRRALEIVATQARNLSGITDQLVKLAQGELGRTTSFRQASRLSDLIQECWRPHAAKAAARGLRLTWDIDPAWTLLGGRDKLGVVVGNLLTNAVRYTDEGGSIAITASRAEDGGVTLLVANSGSAVRGDQVPLVVERYWRGAGAGERGYGLGLHLAARMIKAIHARMRIASEPGGLFQVELHLPVHLATRR